MPLTHVRTFRVRHHECDAYGHVNHANYLRYMQEAAFDATAAAGYDLAHYEAMGCHWLARETDIEYLRPLHYGDSVLVKTWVADFRRVRSLRAYEFRLAESGELAARAHTEWVFLDSVTLRPTLIPRELKVAFPTVNLVVLLAPQIILSTVFQKSAGVLFAMGEMIGPVTGFVVLGLIAAWLLVAILRGLSKVA